MASQKLFIDIVARDKATRALTGLQGGLAKVRGAVFNLKNAFLGLGAGLVVGGAVLYLTVFVFAVFGLITASLQ